MTDAATPQRPGVFVLAPDHFQMQRDRRKPPRNFAGATRQKSAEIVQLDGMLLSAPAPNPGPPLSKLVAASSSPMSEAERVEPDLARRPEPVSDPTSRMSADATQNDPAPGDGGIQSKLRARVDLARAKQLADSMAGHGKRAFQFAKSGVAKGVALSSRAAAWSGRQTGRIVSRVSQLLDSGSRPRTDPLEELASAAHYTAVSNRFASLADLSEREELAVRQGTPDRRIHQAGSEIALESETTPAPMFVASGWACRARVYRDGRRQIVGFLLPGDGIAVSTGPGALANTTITALTSVETVSAEGIIAMTRDAAFPGIANALQRSCALDDEFLVNQIMRLGVSTVVERIAHLLLEFHWRLGQAGLASETLFPLPVTEDTLGDALGLKPQAVKRVLTQLQSHGFIKRGYGSIQVMREDRLRGICGFRAPLKSVRASSRRLMCDANAPAVQVPREPNQAPKEELLLRKRAPFDVVGQILPKLDRHAH